ncbi:MAG: ribose-phosphate pyrophosphokinase [Proteobacteria bacterium]|nr:ribose-phosphate pyrophosphokinase [Pseudomonadota bacterium]MBU1388251.1 ribose-phosphate pyrophosphokinase [Pseudomonadota bacterium]MBU1541860.1 ribose-phosphate pyrophosphokinase [Pseudomonadota bacterium]MBU2429414.1 ribose-phosphate pyrophosphokinase [Pseudomonadota bacterium]MBU2479619.1 ribose-phosphate pyrophosphokinase [Pseudomonadota bacterium]
MTDNLKVFSSGANTDLAKEICDHIEIPLSRLAISRFSNDNLFVQIQESVREKDVFVVQSLTHPASDNLMALLLTLDALRSASAKRITAVIPYYSYARSDKKDAPRISIAGRLIADLLKTAGADRVLTMDLHADSVHGFFSMPVDHLTAVPTLCDYFSRTLDLSRAVVVATDAGGAKRAGRFAERLKTSMAIIDKRRISDSDVKQGLVVGDVKGKDAIVFDDEISTGSTLVATVQTLENAGVKNIYVGATHPVLCGDAVANLRASHIAQVVVANTVHIPENKQFSRLKVLSVAALFSQAILRIHTGESVSALFT